MDTTKHMLTVQRIEELLASSRPGNRLLRGSTAFILGLSMLLGAMVADPDLLGRSGLLSWLLPQAVLVALVIIIVRRTRRERYSLQLMANGFEAVQLREWKRAQDLLARSLRCPVRHASARAEALLALAAAAEADHRYDVSQRIYESLIEENAGDPIQVHTSRVAMAAAMLRTGQTTDAVALIDRLSRMDLPGPLRAQVELLSLFREVMMGHSAAGIDRAEERRELFRKYLSTRAGYGYGLLAAAFDQVNQPDRAGHYWYNATLLIPPKELVERFEELAPLMRQYPAAEMAL